MAQEMEIKNGSTIKFAGETEEFTVSQWDGYRGWAGDEDGCGWYFTADQVIVVEKDEDGTDYE